MIILALMNLVVGQCHLARGSYSSPPLILAMANSFGAHHSPFLATYAKGLCENGASYWEGLAIIQRKPSKLSLYTP